MGTRGLLRLTTTSWGSGRATTAPCLKPLAHAAAPRRRASTVRSDNGTRTSHNGQSGHFTSKSWPTIPTKTILPHSTACSTSTRLFTSNASPHNSKPPTSRRRRLLYILAGLALTIHTLNYLRNPSSSSSNARKTLNKTLFTPCTVLSNTPISPTAFLLTVALPPTTPLNSAILTAAHHHGLWSVEIKQPQLQIARNYTPLPPPPASSPTDQQQPQLQFYVRRYAGGGEVSNYLSRLPPGAAIELRGPHLGFDLRARLGLDNHDDAPTPPITRRKVVFLAGGTGVAPALQTAAVLLDQNQPVDVDVLWASRGAEDCAGCARVERQSGWLGGWFSRGQRSTEKDEEEPSAIVQQLAALQAAYAARGRRLDVRCAVDAEGGVIRAREVEAAVGAAGPRVPIAAAQGSSSSSAEACYFHSQRVLEGCTEESDAAGESPRAGAGGKTPEAAAAVERKCACVGDGERGRNLLIVSGPGGFVKAFAGSKVWADGGERQGPVGGVVAQLMRKDPDTWKNWLVLKQ